MAPSRHTMKIAIDDWQHQKLRETATLSHKRLSSLVREIISEKLDAPSTLHKIDPIFGIIGMASGDGTAVAESHDDVLYARASEILQREEMLRLTERDARTFLDALETPSAPTAVLLDALQAHTRLVKCW